MIDLARFLVLANANPAGTSAAPAGLPEMSLLDYVQAGGLLSYVMVGLSILAVSLVIRNLLVLRMSVLAPPEVVRNLDQLLRANDMEGANRFCQQSANRCFVTSIIGHAIARCLKSPFGFLEFRSAVEESAQQEVDKLHRLNDGIGILAAVGPMLGLLGTVIGMIGAFRTIGTLEGASRSSELAKFMSLALVNTAEGLIIAIPCTVIFALFRRRTDKLVSDAGVVLEELGGHLAGAEKGPGAAPRSAPAAPPRPAPAPRGAAVP